MKERTEGGSYRDKKRKRKKGEHEGTGIEMREAVVEKKKRKERKSERGTERKERVR